MEYFSDSDYICYSDSVTANGAGYAPMNLQVLRHAGSTSTGPTPEQPEFYDLSDGVRRACKRRRELMFQI